MRVLHMTQLKEIKEELIKHDIRPSYPRLRIMEYLYTRRNHPTVDEIYTALVNEILTLSKTTVYNTLNLFVDANMVRAISIEKNETRYDADTSDHGHFKCKRCREIIDCTIEDAALTIRDLNGFAIIEKHVYLEGICPGCLEDVDKQNKGGLHHGTPQ